MISHNISWCFGFGRNPFNTMNLRRIIGPCSWRSACVFAAFGVRKIYMCLFKINTLICISMGPMKPSDDLAHFSPTRRGGNPSPLFLAGDEKNAVGVLTII